MRVLWSSITGLTTLAAVVTADFAVLRALPSVPSLTTRIGLFGALPMVNVMAVCLVIAISSLQKRGDVALPRVMFTFVGGTAILLLLYIAILAPYLFYRYLDLTVGTLERLGPSLARPPAVVLGANSGGVHRFGIAVFRFVQVLASIAVAILPLMLPALLAGRATRGQCLKLVKRHETQGQPGGGEAF